MKVSMSPEERGKEKKEEEASISIASFCILSGEKTEKSLSIDRELRGVNER